METTLSEIPRTQEIFNGEQGYPFFIGHASVARRRRTGSFPGVFKDLYARGATIDGAPANGLLHGKDIRAFRTFAPDGYYISFYESIVIEESKDLPGSPDDDIPIA